MYHCFLNYTYYYNFLIYLVLEVELVEDKSPFDANLNLETKSIHLLPCFI